MRLHVNFLVGQVRKRKTHRDVLAVVHRLPARHPAETGLYTSSRTTWAPIDTSEQWEFALAVLNRYTP